MPSLLATRSLPWQAGTALLGGGVDAPWQRGEQLLGEGGSAYTPGAPPGGGTVITPGVGGALYRIKPRGVYLSAPAWDLRDARDDTVLAVSKVSISSDVDSTFWTIRAEGGGGALYAQLLAGDQPARVRFTAEGQTWEFIVDTLARSREFDGTTTSFVGRSLAALAAGPFQATRNWTNEADTVASQICASALRDTGVLLDWRVDDWAVPEGVFSLGGTPLQVVKAFADAVGAVVRSHPWLPILEVLPRYPTLPNEWRTSGVDLDLALDAVLSEQLERVESAEYDGVYLSGQQGGIIGFVRLQGTSGAKTHPYLSDPLLCDVPALQQRARALLGASTGGQVRVPMTLPVLYGAGAPGVLELNQLVRVQDPAGVWYGLLRSVSASFEHGQSRQQVALERHLQLWQGSVAEEVLYTPLRFVPSIDDQAATAGIAFSLDVSGNWADGYGARTYSMRSGSLPTGLALNAVSGVISGTPTVGSSVTNIALRCVDEEGGMADSNEFDITVNVAAPVDYLVKLKFEADSYATTTSSSSPSVTNTGTAGSGTADFTMARWLLSSGATTPEFTSFGRIGAGSQKYGSKGFGVFFDSRAHPYGVYNTGLNYVDVNVGTVLVLNKSVSSGASIGATDTMTIGTWCRRNSDDGTQRLTLLHGEIRSGSLRKRMAIFADFGGTYSFKTYVGTSSAGLPLTNSSVFDQSLSLSLPPGNEFFLECSMGDGVARVFVNGSLQGTLTLTGDEFAADRWSFTVGHGIAAGNTNLDGSPAAAFYGRMSWDFDESFCTIGAPLHTGSFTPSELPA